MGAIDMPGNIMGDSAATGYSGGFATAGAQSSGTDSDNSIADSSGQPLDQTPQTLTFKDVLDIVNPLQHIPIVGTIYRAITGDTMKDYVKIVGDTLYGGAIGLASSVGTALVKQATGESPEDMVMAALGFGAPGSSDTPADSVQLADNGPVTDQSLLSMPSTSGVSGISVTSHGAHTIAGYGGSPDGPSLDIVIPAPAATPGAAGSSPGITASAPIASATSSPALVAQALGTPISLSSAHQTGDGSASGHAATPAPLAPPPGSANSALIARAFSTDAASGKIDPATLSAAMDYGLRQYQAMNRVNTQTSALN